MEPVPVLHQARLTGVVCPSCRAFFPISVIVFSHVILFFSIFLNHLFLIFQ